MTKQGVKTVDTWVGKVLLTIILAVSGWTLTAVLDLQKALARIDTASVYEREDTALIKDDIRSLHAADASLQAQVQDLRDNNYKHGWR